MPFNPGLVTADFSNSYRYRLGRLLWKWTRQYYWIQLLFLSPSLCLSMSLSLTNTPLTYVGRYSYLKSFFIFFLFLQWSSLFLFGFYLSLSFFLSVSLFLSFGLYLFFLVSHTIYISLSVEFYCLSAILSRWKPIKTFLQGFSRILSSVNIDN